MKKRKIPATMVSQHPDHAHAPYWQKDPFISTRAEIEECFLSFSELGVSEYKWDWEGKLVDESVIERLLTQYYEYFAKHPLGSDKFLTFRLPNPRVQTEFRIGRAFMGMLSSAAMAKELNLPAPLFEAILPMTISAEEMIDVQDAFVELASLKHPLYKLDKESVHHLELIPLFEDIETIMKSDEILQQYLAVHTKRWGYSPKYMRPYIARSDPALNSGLVSTVLAIKIGLSRYAQLEEEKELPLFPILGVAALPFRGSLRPDGVNQFVQEYKGIRTALIQSAFRYDYPLEMVKQAIQELEQQLPKQKAVRISKDTEKELKQIISYFEKAYQSVIELLAPSINHIAGHLPKRRERVQHTGLFGYSRGTESVKLPRAIGFTGALYSMGVPPELLGTGRGLHQAKLQGELKTLEKYYINLQDDLERVSHYIHREFIQSQAKRNPKWQLIWQDVLGLEEFLGHEVGPVSDTEKQHKKVVSKIHKAMETGTIPTEPLTKAAMLRKSMG